MHNMPHSEETKRKISNKLKGNIITFKIRNKIAISIKKYYDLKGRKTLKFCRLCNKKISPYTNSGLCRYCYSQSEEFKQKISKVHKGKTISIETRIKLSNHWKGKKQTKELIAKRLRKRLPTNLEYKMQEIIENLNLPFRYVGNGHFFIENLNPDFIDENNKIIIEVYSEYYKKLHNDINIWKEKRKDLFLRNGWKSFFFNEKEVNKENVINQLIIGHK